MRRRGFVLDGFPRTVAQALALDEIMDERNNGPLVVVDVVVPERGAGAPAGQPADLREVRDERGAGRRRDRCTKCGGALVQRTDDNQDVVLERLKVYERATRPVLEFYRERPTFRVVNGAQAPEQVAQRARHDDRRRGGGRRRGEGAAVVIVCRSQAEIDKLRRVNQLVARMLAELRAMVAPGVTTQDIDAVAEARVREAGAEPAFKGYHGYPATVCASVNEQVVHGIPSTRPLVEGDIVSIDMGASSTGFSATAR